MHVAPKSPVLEITVYGRTVTVRAYVIDASWYASVSEVVRLVLVRDFPGHDKDDVLVCTDPTLSKRRSLEVKFHDAKGKLGFEDPRIAPSEPSSAPPQWRSSATASPCSGTSSRVIAVRLRAIVTSRSDVI